MDLGTFSVGRAVRDLDWIVALTLIVCVSACVAEAPGADPRQGDASVESRESSSPLAGAWAAEQYRLAGGDAHTVEGRIFFTDREWTVLFFVVDPDGTARRASAEGGEYAVEADVLTFTHRFHFSRGSELPGLSDSPLRMEIREAGHELEEPTRFSLEGEVLTLHFPSGNRMSFRRSSSVR